MGTAVPLHPPRGSGEGRGGASAPLLEHDEALDRLAGRRPRLVVAYGLGDGVLDLAKTVADVSGRVLVLEERQDRLVRLRRQLIQADLDLACRCHAWQAEQDTVPEWLRGSARWFGGDRPSHVLVGDATDPAALDRLLALLPPLARDAGVARVRSRPKDGARNPPR